MEFDENLNPIQPEPNNNPTPPQPEQPTPAPQPAPQPAPAPQPQPTPPAPEQPKVAPAASPLAAPILRNSNLKGTSLVLLGAIVVAVILGTAILLNANSNKPSGIVPGQQEGLTVQADAKVYATPDVAKINFGIERKNPNVGTIEQEMSAVIRAVRDRLKDLGVKDADVRTIDLTIDNRNYEVKPMIEPFPAPGAPTTDFTGRHILEVTVRDLDQIDRIIDAAIAAGANRVQGVYFTVEDSDKLFQEARSKAIAKAKDKAKQLAKDADIRLGRLTSISEWSSSPYMDRAVGTGGAAPEVAPGSLEIVANVTLVYDIR